MISPADLSDLRVSLDRETVRRGGLRAFVRLAWPQIEPNPFVDSWHIGAICEHLEALIAGQILDLCICIPPGASKSLIGSTLFPAFDWIQNPARRIISVSYAQNLAEKNARLHRDLVGSEWYQARWPGTSIGKDDLAKVRMFANSRHGWRFTSSVGGEVTGRHADLILGDDLAKAQDAQGKNIVDPQQIQKANDLWFGVLQTRRANPAQTRRLLIGQRLHVEDTPGKALERGYTGLVLPMEYTPKPFSLPSGKPVRLLPAAKVKDPRKKAGDLLLPERFPKWVVEQDRAGMSAAEFAAQNNQDPQAAGGLIFKSVGDRRWIKVPDDARKIIVVDAAFKDTKKSDFVSIQVWGAKDPNYYLIANDTDRMSFTVTCQRILSMMAAHPGCPVYVEDKANGPAIMDTLQGQIAGVIAWSPGTASKTSRAEARAFLFESGNVFLPPDESAPWIVSYINELSRFPNVKNDDQADATSMALLILHQPSAKSYADAVAILKGRR